MAFKANPLESALDALVWMHYESASIHKAGDWGSNRSLVAIQTTRILFLAEMRDRTVTQKYFQNSFYLDAVQLYFL